jgi:hypothetical protein
MKESDASKHAANNGRIALLNSGKKRIYSGSVPANVAASLGAAVMLAEHTLAATAFTDTNGVATAAAIADVTIVASGTASFSRCYASDGTTAHTQHLVATSGAEVTVPTTTYTAGVLSHITSFTMTQPDGT